jgi:hypothetical protein
MTAATGAEDTEAILRGRREVLREKPYHAEV